VVAVTQAGGFGPLGMVREPEALIMIRSEVEALRGRGIERFGVNLIPAATAGQHKNRNLKNLTHETGRYHAEDWAEMKWGVARSFRH
jgi:hypothetical protein